MLLSGSYDDHVNLMEEAEDGEWAVSNRIKTGDCTVWCLDFGPEDREFVVAGDDGVLSWWSVQEAKVVQRLELGEKVVSCSWSRLRDDIVVACGQEWIWLIKRNIDGIWECASQVEGHEGRDVNCVEMSGWEEGVFASSGDDQHVRIWTF